MAKIESGKGGKSSERRVPKKKEGSSAPHAVDQGSDESKFAPRMRETYLQKVVPALMKEFGYKNIMQVGTAAAANPAARGGHGGGK